MWARKLTRELAAEGQAESKQGEVSRHHSPVLLGQVLGVEVEDRQTSVGKLLEVMVLHG